MKSYYKNFPTVQYYFSDKEKSFIALDFFVRVKFLDELETADGLFQYYKVNDGDRPDTVAFKVYGDSELDWMVLFANRIIDPKDWLIPQGELEEFINAKYPNPYQTKFLERNGEVASIKAANIRHLINPFNTVDSFPPNSPETDMDPVQYTAVTFRDFEVRKNDSVRVIRLVRPDYIQAFLLQLEKKLKEL